MLLMNVYISSSIYYIYHRFSVMEVSNLFLLMLKVKKEDNSYRFHYDTLNVHAFNWLEMTMMKVKRIFVMYQFPLALA